MDGSKKVLLRRSADGTPEVIKPEQRFVFISPDTVETLRSAGQVEPIEITSGSLSGFHYRAVKSVQIDEADKTRTINVGDILVAVADRKTTRGAA